MKTIKQPIQIIALLLVLGLTTQCQQTGKQEAADEHASMEQVETPVLHTDSLVAVLQSVEDPQSLKDSIGITFTVSNLSADTLKFTQYHTPFEGFISNFIALTDSTGTAVRYIGAMAKRVSPPPAESFHSVAPGAEKSISFDLKKGYAIESPGTYTLQYIGSRVSGIASGEAIQIHIVE